ncbi:MAG: tetratricopeptide repeat protein [Saprospiraceae bacterium]|nr:tetratricopeptide repeat protein [Saprospiraceae bacterium]
MRTIYAILFFCVTEGLCAQERFKADSLLRVLDQSQGRERVELLRHLSRAYIGADKEKSIHYAQESVAEAEKLGNDTFIVRSLNNLAAAYQNTGDKRSSLPCLERAIGIARKNSNKIQLLESLEFKATAYAGMGQTDKALPFAQEALSLAEEIKDSVGILNGLEIIAAAYKDLHKFEEAVQVFRKEIDLLEFMPKRLFEKGRVSVNLGEVYVLLGREADAIALFKKGREYFTQFGYPVGALIATMNLANCYLDNGQLDAARQAYLEVLEMNKAIQEPELESVSYTGLGLIEMQKHRFQASLEYYKQAESIAQPAGLHAVMKELYGNMNDLFCLQGDYETAKKYKQLSKQYADSLLNADVLDRISAYQVQYETVQKEKEIAEQQLQITAQQSEIFRKNTINYTLLASLLAFAVLGWLFYNRFRLRKKAELDAAVIQEQKLGLNAVIEAQEAERKRIAKDLHDGIAQELVALKLGFDALARRVGKINPEESPHFAELGEQLDASCSEIRSIAHIMSPPVLEQKGLAPSLELLLRHTLQHTGLEARLHVHDLPAQLNEKTAVGLYRITQELLNNIVKHAKAAKVMIELYTAGPDLVLRVEDDGVGYNFEDARSMGSMGLLNILSRAGALGGVFFTENNQPHGTVALVRVPI